MSKTLFWYVMRDLLRVFLMTSLVLAGIMSFGGLLKLSSLEVHQPEVRMQFGDFGVSRGSFAVELGGTFEIPPGLGLLRRGQERLKSDWLLRECYTE